MLDGKLVLLNNNSIQSDAWSRRRDNERFVNYYKNWDMEDSRIKSFHERIYEYALKNEFALIDWKPKSLVIDFDGLISYNKEYSTPENIKTYINSLKKFNMPILNSKGEKVNENNFRENISLSNCKF